MTTTGLQILFPPPCRDKGTRYLVSSFCLYLVAVVVVAVVVQGSFLCVVPVQVFLFLAFGLRVWVS